MNSPHNVGSWVVSFCCISPFCALLLFSIAATRGLDIGATGTVGVVLLCAKTTHWLLHSMPTDTS